ncbi:RHS repeat domain-containing protein [Lysobacter sp. CA199]|uniref:RHS repeat domain-containing protein n=1 Tax=Lysobacter sp. CA199 TaxID=3455608 RepID=UPI003F8CF8EA
MKWISKFVAAAILASVASSAHAQTAIEYIHTDALGSPVAVTDANQNVIERTEYEPYGAQINRPVQDGQGYTGHVSDAATGLSYMQQRYYDPQIGRFLSVDPVQANMTGANFGRYLYANNNPYKFTDPDERQGEFFALRMVFATAGADAVTPDPSDAVAPAKIGLYGAAIAGTAIGGAIVWAMNQAQEAGNASSSEGNPHAPGDVPDEGVIVRGGQGDMPEPGTTFSGSQGGTVEEASAGVPHNTIRPSTAGEIRGNGGTVEVAPEPTRSGNINGQHVNVTEGGRASSFGPPQPNPVLKEDRIK